MDTYSCWFAHMWGSFILFYKVVYCLPERGHSLTSYLHFQSMKETFQCWVLAKLNQSSINDGDGSSLTVLPYWWLERAGAANEHTAALPLWPAQSRQRKTFTFYLDQAEGGSSEAGTSHKDTICAIILTTVNKFYYWWYNDSFKTPSGCLVQLPSTYQLKGI